MAVHRITKGLDLPIAGQPRQRIEPARAVSRVALLGDDYVGMRPTMQVAVGDRVKRGQLLFEDKKMPGVRFTAPAAGTVLALHRGDKRAFQSVVIELSESERSGRADETDLQRFEAYAGGNPLEFDRDQLTALLVESGLWTSLRARPFGRVAVPGSMPRSIFITAIDTNPLAPSVDVALKGREADFELGVRCLAKLTDGRTFICKAPGSSVPAPRLDKVQVEEFAGPHPAGTAGLHVHLLDPVCRAKTIWYINYQDVVAVGRLVSTGILDVERVIALGGPVVKNPRLLRTRQGTSLDELVAGELEGQDNRVVSGSVLSGRKAMGEEHGYLGRYHLQVSALHEGRERELLNWVMPGSGKFSLIGAYLAAFLPGRANRRFNFTTTTNGSDRAIVPIGMYERVMPMDIQPTYLLRSLVMHDVERAEQLGVLELDEEDVALCTLVCPGKIEYGPLLRENLTVLEKEG